MSLRTAGFNEPRSPVRPVTGEAAMVMFLAKTILAATTIVVVTGFMALFIGGQLTSPGSIYLDACVATACD